MATTSRKLFAGKKISINIRGEGGLTHNWLTGYIYSADTGIGSTTIKTGCYIQPARNKTFGSAYNFYGGPNKGHVIYILVSCWRSNLVQLVGYRTCICP